VDGCDALTTAYGTVFDQTASLDESTRTSAQNAGGQIQTGVAAVSDWEGQAGR